MENQLQTISRSELAGFQSKALETFLSVKSQLSSLEVAVMEAMTNDITIGMHHERKPFHAQTLFKELIAYGSSTCGVNTEPDRYTMGNLNTYVFSQLKNYTFEEIKRAIYFNAAGEFPERIPHYNLFDMEFLSKVMTEWLIIKNKTRNKITELLPKPKDPQPETNEQRFQGLLNYITVNNKFPDFWAWIQVWEHMEESGLIRDSEEEKKALWKKVKSELEAKLELELLSVPDFIERSNLKDGLQERVVNEYRRLRIVKNLSYLIDTSKRSSTS